MEWMWRACGSLTEAVEIQYVQANFSSLSFSLLLLHFSWADTMTSAEVELPRNFANNFWVSESTSTMIRKLCNTGEWMPWVTHSKIRAEMMSAQRFWEGEWWAPNKQTRTWKPFTASSEFRCEGKPREPWAGSPIPERMRMRCSNSTLWTHSPPLFQGSTSWRIWQKAAETFKNGYWKRRDRVSLKKYRLYPLL